DAVTGVGMPSRWAQWAGCDSIPPGGRAMATFKDLPQVQADGLAVAEVGAWGEEKYRLVGLYASLFCSAMRGKWDCLVYIDLFAGPGYAQFEGSSRIVAGSPLIALGLEDKFDRYVFCEASSE